MKGLEHDSRLYTNVEEARRGSIVASDKTRLAEDFPSLMVSVIPGAIAQSQEEEMFKTLGTLWGGKPAVVALHQRVAGNTLPDSPVPLGVVTRPLEEKEISQLLAYPAISLTPHLGRRYRPSNIVTVGTLANVNYFECCSLLYSATNYKGDSGIEKEKNDILAGVNGGQLVIKDSSGNIIRTILQVFKRDGEDVQL